MVATIHSSEDARRLARRRLPRMIFDFVDGAAGYERASALNRAALDAIRLQPRVLINVEQRSLASRFLGQEFAAPFGVAPMGMCALSWPGADRFLADAAVRHGIAVGVSTAASLSLEAYFHIAGPKAWFQLYVSQSSDAAFELVRRAADVGYETLILTVDTPQVARRPREARSGFNVPFSLGPRQLVDLALHPRWSLATLREGVPEPANFRPQSHSQGTSAGRDPAADKFDRQQSRGGVDWAFLAQLRDRWRGKLIVKGVLFAADAVRLRDAGVDAVYVSNHGGRQLDSAPAAIRMLALIRDAVGEDYPLLFDSGVRSGEDIIKALAQGANFVMIGRPMLHALGAGGERGLQRIVELFADDLDRAMAQMGCTSIEELNLDSVAEIPWTHTARET